MKVYQTGEIYKGDTLIGAHDEDIDDLILQEDERGKYAPFPDNQPPASAVMFSQGDMLLKKLGKFQTSFDNEEFFIAVFGRYDGEHLFRKYRKNLNVVDFFRCLDEQNSKLFLAAIMKL